MGRSTAGSAIADWPRGRSQVHTFISHLIVRLGLDPVRVAKIAGQASVTQTLNTYAEEFDKAIHRDDLLARIEAAGFGSV